VFVERFDENGAMYHWKGIKAGDIVSPFTREADYGSLCSYKEKSRSHSKQRHSTKLFEMPKLEKLKQNMVTSIPSSTRTTAHSRQTKLQNLISNKGRSSNYLQHPK